MSKDGKWIMSQTQCNTYDATLNVRILLYSAYSCMFISFMVIMGLIAFQLSASRVPEYVKITIVLYYFNFWGNLLWASCVVFYLKHYTVRYKTLLDEFDDPSSSRRIRAGRGKVSIPHTPRGEAPADATLSVGSPAPHLLDRQPSVKGSVNATAEELQSLPALDKHEDIVVGFGDAPEDGAILERLSNIEKKLNHIVEQRRLVTLQDTPFDGFLDYLSRLEKKTDLDKWLDEVQREYGLGTTRGNYQVTTHVEGSAMDENGRLTAPIRCLDWFESYITKSMSNSAYSDTWSFEIYSHYDILRYKYKFLEANLRFIESMTLSAFEDNKVRRMRNTQKLYKIEITGAVHVVQEMTNYRSFQVVMALGLIVYFMTVMSLCMATGAFAGTECYEP
eukprot:CAMPEP_0119142770 /NCGR_PEP_ID=MMETSP1310-20130426/33251_1 /TAXON_ID=464262 /ORGANISM="Genus nov. species nov., Strain RCC2339" /LENGTH=390 /DNA_ID=CAMNT_0007134339 /DNA_START=332 /DNA_END=1501 /DNA_ORIENTATION=+